MQKISAYVLLAFIVVFFIYLNTPGAAAWRNQVDVNQKASRNLVTLKASPISNVAQMFEHVGLGEVGSEGVTTQFPDGTACSKLSGPTEVDFGDGLVLNFLKLNCRGTVGYVNVRWVND